MSNREEAVEELLSLLTDFLDDLNEKVDTHQFENILKGEEDNLSSHDFRQSPEPYAEQNLIWPILEALDQDVTVRPFAEGGGRGEWPDFRIESLGKEIIGENKPFNNVEQAEKEIKDYLDRKSLSAEYGIATDGITWILYKIEVGTDFTEFPIIEEFDLRPVLISIARERGHLSAEQLGETNVEQRLSEFADVFIREQLDRLVTEEAPKLLKERKKKDVEDFYDLYIELLFGEGQKHDYENTLIDDIVGPENGSDKDRRVFGITLINRLLFIKFLEKKGVIPEEVLTERVENYETSKDLLMENLYDSQIKPLFYDLFNTPIDDRKPKHRKDWFGEIPYLNGGLFRENIDQEDEYTVRDEMLKTIITDLIEGHKLEKEGEFDPSVIGSVFEKTITYIEHEREQKDIGAYYTPNEVTKLISRKTIDPRLNDEIIEVILDHYSLEDNEEVESYLQGLDTSGIFRKIEEAKETVIMTENSEIEIDFGDEELLNEILASFRELKILDPACGSGHFLTTALDEIQKAQVSILRGLGEETDDERVFEEKKQTALNSIYGVDVDRIATEIAKLRVWLKIIEDGWKEEYGKLPNIDVNIAAGNSLVGFPFTGQMQSSLTLTDEGIEELEEYRRLYKEGDESYKDPIENLEQDIKEGLDVEYIRSYNEYCEDSFQDKDSFRLFLNQAKTIGLFNAIKSIKVEKTDGSYLDDGEKNFLESKGYDPAKKSARLEMSAKKADMSDVESREEDFIQESMDLFDKGFEVVEIERQPTSYDLDNILGETFHWHLEFPETRSGKVSNGGNGNHKAKFDIIIGNPPYGDILGKPERMLVSSYETSDVRDIAAQFVERQLQLLKEGGYFGNITTLRLVYQSNLAGFHDMLRKKMGSVEVACFAHRPLQVFDNAIVRVSIFTGRKDDDTEGELKTSEFLQIPDEDEREKIFSNISYSDVDDLFLRETIGGNDRSYEVTPKVGSDEIKEILEKLRDQSSRKLGDIENQEQETNHPAFRKRGSGYWVGFYDRHPYAAHLYDQNKETVRPLYYPTQLDRDTAFLVVNSNLFFLYYMTYGDFRHQNTGMIRRFPYPQAEKIEENSDLIERFAEELWDEMDDHSSVDKRYDIRTIDMSQVKPKIDEIERELISDLYDLTDEQVEFLNSYKEEVRLSS